MAVFTLAIAEQHLSGWLAADSAVAKGQAYQIGGRALTRADAAEIRRNITFWQGWVNKLNRSGIRTRGAVGPHE